MNLNELMEQAEQLPDGLQKVSLLEDIIRILDSAGDVHGAFDQRLKLIESAMWAGLHERSLVAFVAYLHQFDQSPELQEDYESFFWAYYGIVWFTVDQPAIPLARVDQMFDDLRTRFERLNLNTRPVDHLRWRVDMATGWLDRAQELCETWRKGRTTPLCYDRPSQLDSVVELYFRCGRFQDAIESARPIFEQNLRSGPVPGLTYCNVMIAHLALGELEEADSTAIKLQQFLKSRHSLGCLYEVAFLFVYFVHRREMTDAMKLFRRYIRWAAETTDKDNISLFLNAAAGMFRVLAEGKQTLLLSIPATMPGFRDDGKYELSQMAADIEMWIDNVSLTFDARNQNSVYSDRIKFFRSLCMDGRPK